MINLATNIPNPLGITVIKKFEVIDVQEHDTAAPPFLTARVRLLGNGGNDYGDPITVVAYDEQASTCLRVKAVPQTDHDAVELHSAVVSGAYTALAKAWNGNVGGTPSKAKRMKAVEALLVGTLLSADFAGT
jgi:hypothetical protein